VVVVGVVEEQQQVVVVVAAVVVGGMQEEQEQVGVGLYFQLVKLGSQVPNLVTPEWLEYLIQMEQS
jgi:hypothetical protein